MAPWLAQSPLPDIAKQAESFGIPSFVPWLLGGVVAMLVGMRIAIVVARLMQGAPGTPRALRSEARRQARRGEHERAGDLFRAAGDFDAAIEQFQAGGLPNKAADLLASRGNFAAAAPLFEHAQMWEPAAEAFRKAANVKRAEANYLRAGKKVLVARMLEDAGQHAKAAAYYREIGKLDKAADLFERVGKAAEAAELVEKLYFLSIAGLADRKAAMSRQDAQRLEERVVGLYRRAEQAEKVVDFYLRAGLYLKAAELCLEIGEAGKAIDLFLQAGAEDRAAQLLDARGEALKASRLRGDLAYRKGELFSAARHYEDAGEMRLAGEAYERLGECARAAEAFKKAGDPGQAAFLYARTGDYAAAAELYESSGDLEAALRCYETLKDDAKRAAILTKAGKHVRAGSEFLKIGKWDDAIASLQRVEAGSPDAPLTNALLGIAFFEKGMPRLALEKLDAALAAGPVSAPGAPSRTECHYYRGRSLEAMGELELAILAYESVISADAEFRDAAQRLAELHLRVAHPVGSRAGAPQREGAKTEIMARPRLRGSSLNAGEAARPRPSFSEALSPPGHAGRASAPPSALTTSAEAQTIGPAVLQQGRYRILEEIGRGGMGVVYKCQDTLLDRIVAYKVLSAQIRDFPAALENFLREAKSAARLHHQNIVTLFDFGEAEGGYYMTLEYVSGKNLRQFMKAGPEKDAMRRVFIGICDGLAYAHSQNVVHRDIKPSNILISEIDGRAKILDFGLAKILEDVSATASGVLGTPWYMSPEQVLGTSVNHQSDLYSLGVALFEVLTGELPFKGRDFGYHHVHTIPPSPRTVNPNVSEDMARIILRCLEKKPEDRFATAGEVAEAIKIAKL